MHLTRAQVSRKLPIPRKGTKYIARASSHVKNGVPVVVAIRDMLELAKTSREVREMVKAKLIKINGKVVKDLKESIRIFNILEADKKYKLIILPTGRFKLEQTKEESFMCKVVDKKILRGKKVQLNMHDGTNVLSKEKVGVNDSVELDFSRKIKKSISFEKGKKVIVLSGRRVGLNGKIDSVKNGNAVIKLEGKEGLVELGKDHLFVV